MIRFDSSRPDVCLRVLADLCDNYRVKPEDIPPECVDHFGLEILSNSLDLAFPPLPRFDAQANVRFMESQQFDSYQSLCSTIATRPTDMDRLVCIYCYACRRLSSGSRASDSSVEDVFITGRASETSLAAFIRVTAFKAGITSFVFAPYRCYCKRWDWNAMSPPAAPEYNHDAVVLVIDGVKWIFDPELLSENPFDPDTSSAL
jgi:hypothetical protein